MMRIVLVTGMLTLLLSGCVVSEQQMLRTQRDLFEVQKRLTEAERSLKLMQDEQSGGMRTRVDLLATNQAELRAGLDGLRVDMQSIQGRFDDQQRTSDDLRQELQMVRDELNLRLADLEQRLPESPLLQPAAPATSMPPTASPATAVAAATPAAATAPNESAAEMYNRGLRMIRELKDFTGGREVMEDFLKNYPTDPLRVNAGYWVGETFYAEQSYDRAVLAFETIIQGNPDHPKVGAALLKQGLAFDALGDRSSARLQLQRVIDKFPGSEEAKIAADKLAEWR
ncbi:MAG: tol-pal system protein YbgF [Desulfuromonadales bacterium]|nr:tol-pal system protein YbgF [Desulfuromonadales bacterium]